jgi:hypothetical protein
MNNLVASEVELYAVLQSVAESYLDLAPLNPTLARLRVVQLLFCKLSEGGFIELKKLGQFSAASC